jgi:hypothetical protein
VDGSLALNSFSNVAASNSSDSIEVEGIIGVGVGIGTIRRDGFGYGRVGGSAG